jgi:hypothetical protein
MHVNDWWTVSQGVNQLPNNFSAFELEIAEDTRCSISLTQSDEGLHRNNLKKKYVYSYARLLLVDGEDQLVASDAVTGKSVSIHVDIKKG